jgi:hypothetical protein
MRECRPAHDRREGGLDVGASETAKHAAVSSMKDEADPAGRETLDGRHRGAQAEQVAVDAEAAYLAAHHLREHRDVAECLARVDV